MGFCNEMDIKFHASTEHVQGTIQNHREQMTEHDRSAETHIASIQKQKVQHVTILANVASAGCWRLCLRCVLMPMLIVVYKSMQVCTHVSPVCVSDDLSMSRFEDICVYGNNSMYMV